MASHKYGEIKYGVKVEIDNQSLQTLKAQLKEIQNMTTSSFIGSTNYQGNFHDAAKELMSIKTVAKDVESAMDKAFNPTLGTSNLTKFSKAINNIGIEKISKDLNKLGPTGAAAFNTLATSLVTTNSYFKQTHK